MNVSRLIARGIICLLTICLCDCGGNSLTLGKRVPSFRLDTLRHERFYLEDYRQKTVILVFWATWCRSCKKEMAALEALHRDSRFRDVAMAAVCTDPEHRTDIETIISGLGISYPVLMDTDARLYKRFDIEALPFTMLIRPGGRLAFKRTGYDGVLMQNLEAKLLAVVSE